MSQLISVPGHSSFVEQPIAPLGIIAMPGCEELGEKIDRYLRTWRKETIEDNADFVQFSILRHHITPLGASLYFIRDFVERV